MSIGCDVDRDGNHKVHRHSHLCHPERTRISYYAAPKMTSFAFPASRDRMSFAEPIALNRKSGAAEGSAVLSTNITSPMEAPPSLLSSRAYPDFLLRGTKDDLVCGFHQGKPHELCGTHRTQQENPGQPRDLQFRGPFLEMFFDRANPGFPTWGATHGRLCRPGGISGVRSGGICIPL